MKPVKIVLIGAGSHSFGLMTARALMQAPELHGSHIALVDIAEDKLDIMTRLIQRLNHTWGSDFEITSTIVEIPAIVGADRIYGLGMGVLPKAITAIMELQLYIMDLAVEAAVTGDRQTALEALIIDPNVPDPATAEKILDEMLLAQAEMLPQFH